MISRRAAVGVSAALVAFGLQVPAAADTGNGSTIGYSNIGAGAGWAYANWNGTTNKMWVNATANSLAGGWYQDGLFDWATSSGHYDARASRTCDSNSTMFGPTLTDYSQVTGLQKFGTCYGPDQNTKAGVCTNESRATSSIATVPVTWCHDSVRSDTRLRGIVYPCSGGSPTSA